MKTSRFIIVSLTCSALLLGSGCGKKEITDLQRKQAELLVGEAQSASLFRNWAEAEEKMAKAVALNPEAGGYWVSLGILRKKLGKKDAAKDAYKGALSAFEDEAKNAKEPKPSEPWLQQVYVLALLGRADDSRALLAKIEKQFPKDPQVLQFVARKQLDAILTDPKFKENAL